MTTKAPTRTRLPLAVLAALATACTASAQVIWDGDTNTTWSTGGNWDTGTAPTSGQIAVFSLANPINQPTVTANTSILGLTLTVNPTITINNGVTLTVTGATNTTGSAGITLRGAGTLAFTASGSDLNFGSGTITLDGGGLQIANITAATVNTNTGLPTGVRSFNNHIAVTENGGRLVFGGSGSNTDARVINSVALGGALTISSSGGGNSQGYSISGDLTLLQDVTRTLRLTSGTSHNGADWIAGKITDGVGSAGNAFRVSVSGRALQISNGANDYTGGTIIEAGGASIFSYLDVTSAATLGTGNLTVESSGRIRLGNATALGIAGNLASNATISLAAGGAVGVNTNNNIANRFTSDSAGVYGIEGSRNYNIDQGAMGNGEMFLGTVTGGNYSGVLTPGVGNIFRLGGGHSAGSLVSGSNVNVLTISGVNSLSGSSGLLVGSGLNTNASAGRVVMAANQDFVGDIVINPDGLLATSLLGGTPFGNTNNRIIVHGTLAATGANGVFNNAIYSQIDLRPGGGIVLNNNLFNNTAGGNNNDRWLNSQGITLNGSSFSLQGARNSDTSETIGTVTFNGNSRLQIVRTSNNPQNVILEVDSISREAGGTLAFVVGNSGGLALMGADTANSTVRFVSSTAPTLLNGNRMVAPFMIGYDTDANGNISNTAFLTYNGDQGVNVGGTRGFTSATFTSTALNSATSTDLVNAGSTTLSTNPTVYALRVTGAISSSGSNTTVTIGSGNDPAGLIDQNNGNTHTAFFNFAAREAILWKLSGNPTTYNGLITSGGLTKSGPGTIILAGGGHNITGGIRINQGTISVNSANAVSNLANNLLTVNHEGTFNLNDNNVTVAGLAGIGRGANITNSSANLRTLTLDIASGSASYEGRLQGAGTASNLALTKTGDGTQIFTNESVATYTGATSVTAGTLLINGNFAAATGNVTVSGGTLGGSGVIGGATTIQAGGTLAPGNSAGVLTFGNGLTLGGSTLMEINGLTRGTQHDGINVTGGALAYGGSMSIVFGSAFLTGNTSFDLFQFANTPSGNFSSVSSTAFYQFTLNSGNSFNGADQFGNTWSFNHSTGDLFFTAIPEPSAFAALAGLGALGFAALRRRRRA